RYGETRLTAVVRSNLDSPLPQLVETVRDEIERYVGNTEIQDDVTVVGVRFRP
ncbi:MAG: SpoIIE family protein phosphatase, partial [Candidatus Hydrogenedentes bacterium]|nr:SpoIIE family protein phosphatase [Candidatus Hydrogenedentota bacterium]